MAGISRLASLIKRFVQLMVERRRQQRCLVQAGQTDYCPKVFFLIFLVEIEHFIVILQFLISTYSSLISFFLSLLSPFAFLLVSFQTIQFILKCRREVGCEQGHFFGDLSFHLYFQGRFICAFFPLTSLFLQSFIVYCYCCFINAFYLLISFYIHLTQVYFYDLFTNAFCRLINLVFHLVHAYSYELFINVFFLPPCFAPSPSAFYFLLPFAFNVLASLLIFIYTLLKIKLFSAYVLVFFVIFPVMIKLFSDDHFDQYFIFCGVIFSFLQSVFVSLLLIVFIQVILYDLLFFLYLLFFVLLSPSSLSDNFPYSITLPCQLQLLCGQLMIQCYHHEIKKYSIFSLSSKKPLSFNFLRFIKILVKKVSFPSCQSQWIPIKFIPFLMQQQHKLQTFWVSGVVGSGTCTESTLYRQQLSSLAIYQSLQIDQKPFKQITIKNVICNHLTIFKMDYQRQDQFSNQMARISLKIQCIYVCYSWLIKSQQILNIVMISGFIMPKTIHIERQIMKPL